MKALYKFQTLDLYREALEYLDAVSELSDRPQIKRSSALCSRLNDAATHLVVQIAGRTSGDSEIEKSFMVDGSLLSFYETVACMDIIRKRKLLPLSALHAAEDAGQRLHESLQKIKKALKRR